MGKFSFTNFLFNHVVAWSRWLFSTPYIRTPAPFHTIFFHFWNLLLTDILAFLAQILPANFLLLKSAVLSNSCGTFAITSSILSGQNWYVDAMIRNLWWWNIVQIILYKFLIAYVLSFQFWIYVSVQYLVCAVPCIWSFQQAFFEGFSCTHLPILLAAG